MCSVLSIHEPCRSGILLQKGWEAYATRCGLAVGDQLYLQRRGIIARPGCIYLDARRVRSPAILNSGMSTSEQLSEDTQPHRRPSAGECFWMLCPTRLYVSFWQFGWSTSGLSILAKWHNIASHYCLSLLRGTF